MADKRINALANTAPSTASDDFIAVDGTTNGTRKLSAFSPTFGGNVVVTGTLTSGSTLSTSAGLSCANATITQGYAILTGYGASADAGNLFLGQSSNGNFLNSSLTKIYTAIGGAEISNNVAAGFRVVTTTASTTTSSGALVVGNGTSGGLGVGGNITLGGGVNIAGVASDPLPAGTSGIWTLSGSGLRINSAGLTFASLTGTTLATARVAINGTTASTTTSSGALVVSGGVGVDGAINAAGTITSTASTDSGLLQLNLVNSSTGTSASSLFRFNAGTRTATLQAYNDTHATLAGQLRVGTSNGDIVVIPSGVAAATFGASAISLGALNYTNTITGGDSGSGTSIAQFKDGVGSTKINFKGNGEVVLSASTASTSTSSGALVVSGGVGVAGKVTSTALGLANTSQSIPAWGDVGAQLSVAGAVITDTTSSGTVSRFVSNSIAASSIAASSPTTYTQAATLFIAAGPTANTNVTITNSYALFIAGGRINFGGLPTSSAGLQAGTLWNDAGTLKVA